MGKAPASAQLPLLSLVKTEERCQSKLSFPEAMATWPGSKLSRSHSPSCLPIKAEPGTFKPKTFDVLLLSL
jgi:hypothetical protein